MSAIETKTVRPRRTTRPALRAETDGRIEVARWGPLDPPHADDLARQGELAAPAKLAMTEDGRGVLIAEVLRVGGAEAPKRVRGALDVARAWLAGETTGVEPAVEDEDLASAVAELPGAWAWERVEGALRFHVHATAFGESVRLSVEAAPGGARVRARTTLPTPAVTPPATPPVTSAATPAPIAGEARTCSALEARMRFALEANRRLRLARIGLSASSAEATAVEWESITPAPMVSGEALSAAVEAVVRAHAATRRALRALGHEPVARSFLDARKAAPRGRLALPRA